MIDTGRVQWDPPLSAARAAADVAALPQSEWERIPNELRADPYAPVADRLQREYRFGLDEARGVVRYVCDPAHDAPIG